MANVNRPFGARVVQGGVAAGYNAMVQTYPAAAGRSATNNFGDIYVGDFVTLSDGNVVPAASGDEILGVVVGVGTTDDIDHGRSGPYNAPDLEQRYLPFADAGVVYVLTDPNALIEIQETDSGDNLDVSDIGTAVDITATAGEEHGSRFSGESTTEIANTSVNGDVVLVALIDRADNEEGDFAKWLVRVA